MKMNYEIIGSDFRTVTEENTESFYETQLESFFELFTDDKKVIYHELENDSYSIGYVTEVNDYIDKLAIKDGVNLVRFENGNVGFVGVYNGYENGFEIIAVTDKQLEALDMAFDDMEIVLYHDKNEIFRELLEATESDLDNYLEW